MSVRWSVSCGLVLACAAASSGAGEIIPRPTPLEVVPPEEATQIENIVRITVEQLKKRYPVDKPVLRGVHPKDHGCVMARFKVSDAGDEAMRVGVFATPGREYQAYIRFSNASVLVGPDSAPGKHGSRGMAIKLLGVSGAPLIETNGPLTQDFLMVNHPVFAFSNVEDYEAVSQVLLRDKDDPTRFFAERIHRKPDGTPAPDPITQRAIRTLGISRRIQSLSTADNPPAYQMPPASPVDNRYFSGAPYLFGPDKAMRFSARPVAPATGEAPDIADPNYLRTALRKRLTAEDATDVVFEFQVQVRPAADLADHLETEIEDACVDWDEAKYPFVTLATIAIPPQDFDEPARRQLCEDLMFTPWHGVAEHQPIGGINRLKLGVYKASAHFRHVPNEPASF